MGLTKDQQIYTAIDLLKHHGYKVYKDYSMLIGKWVALDECANEGVYCSVCNKKVYKLYYANQKLKSKYCPNCGAIMDGKEES